MLEKTEIDMIIALLKAVLNIIASIIPNAAQNKEFIAIQNIINTLQAMGL